MNTRLQSNIDHRMGYGTRPGRMAVANRFGEESPSAKNRSSTVVTPLSTYQRRRPAAALLALAGTITRFDQPSAPGSSGRWYMQGDTVSQYYDNLIAKLAVWV